MIDPLSLALIVYLAGFIALVGQIYMAMRVKGMSDGELIGAFVVAVLWVPAFILSLVVIGLTKKNE